MAVALARGRLAVVALFGALTLAVLAWLIARPSGFALIALVFLAGQTGLLAWLAVESTRREARLRDVVDRARDDLDKEPK